MYEDVVSAYFDMMQNLLAQPIQSFTESAKTIPAMSGVYVVYDSSKQQLIYVGQSKNMRRRLFGDHKRGNVEGSFFRKALGRSLKMTTEKDISDYIIKNCSFKFLSIPSFPEVTRLEHFATAILAPALNIKRE